MPPPLAPPSNTWSEIPVGPELWSFASIRRPVVRGGRWVEHRAAPAACDRTYSLARRTRPGAHQPRASGTTGAAAPSSRGPRRRLANDMRGSSHARQLAGQFSSDRASSPGVCPKRAARDWVRVWSSLVQDSISLMKIQQERRGRPRTRVQSGMLSNEYGMLACVAHVCDRD